MKIKAVVLDLDQTITTDEASWLQLTTLLGADQQQLQRIYNQFRQGELAYPQAKQQVLTLWRTTGKADKQTLSRLVSKISLRPGVTEAINYLQQKYQLVIISGAIDVFVEAIAKKFAIKHWYAATKFHFDQQGELVDFDYKLSRGEEKVSFLKDFSKETGITLQECAAIGDGESDMPIFAAVGLPILFLADETNSEQKSKIKNQLANWQEISSLL